MSAVGAARCAGVDVTTSVRSQAPRVTASTVTPRQVPWPSMRCARRKCCTSSRLGQPSRRRSGQPGVTHGPRPAKGRVPHRLHLGRLRPGSARSARRRRRRPPPGRPRSSWSVGVAVLDLAAKMGADIVVDYEKEDPVDGVRRLTAGRGVDYVFDCTGNPERAGAGNRRGAPGRPGGHPRPFRGQARRDRRRPAHPRRGRPRRGSAPARTPTRR